MMYMSCPKAARTPPNNKKAGVNRLIFSSELQFQRQLNGPRPADDEERVLAAGAREAGAQDRNRAAKVGARHDPSRVGKIRCIEDVERVGAEVQAESLTQTEASAQREIDLRQIEPAQRAAP